VYLRKVYIRYKEDMPESRNTFTAQEGFRERGVETVPFYGFGDIDTLDDLGPEVGLVGYVGDVQNALKKMGKAVPQTMDYPEELQPWLGRKVWPSTLEDARRLVEPTFIKPYDEEKLFTGFIWRGAGMEAVRVAAIPDETIVWCSEVVNFVSEYRVYIKDDEVLGVHLYKGDWSLALDQKTVMDAVKAYKSSPRAYCLDFGVTSGAWTRLVEANDSYALGNYGLPSALYAQLLEARWEELTR
jgi:hypothetical protein